MDKPEKFKQLYVELLILWKHNYNGILLVLCTIIW